MNNILNELGLKNIKKWKKKITRSGDKLKNKKLAKLNNVEQSHIHNVGDDTAGHLTAGQGSHGTSDDVMIKDEEGNLKDIGPHNKTYKNNRKKLKNHSGLSSFKANNKLKKKQLRPQTPVQMMNQRIALNRQQNDNTENQSLQYPYSIKNYITENLNNFMKINILNKDLK